MGVSIMMEALKFAIVTGSLPWHELGCNSARETLLIQGLTRGISLSFMLHQRKIGTNKKEERNKTSDSWTRCLHIYYNSIEASRKKYRRKKVSIYEASTEKSLSEKPPWNLNGVGECSGTNPPRYSIRRWTRS